MKKAILIMAAVIMSIPAFAQFVARMEVKEPIAGVCDQDNVYALFPSMKGQQEAVCPVSKEELAKRLNSEMQFLKDNPKYNDEGMIGLVINCEGKVVQCKMATRPKVRILTVK